MSNNIVELIFLALEAKAVELVAIRKKRQERIEKAWSEKNQGLIPNVDRNGRFHAPCDGYVDIDERGIYGKGEFLPTPSWVLEMLEREGIHCDVGGESFGKPVKFLVLAGEGEDISHRLTYSYGLRCSFGKMFERDGERMSYIYVTGRESLTKVIAETVNEINEQARLVKLARIAAEREAAKALKGDAPVGRQTVKGVITGFKVSYSNYGETLKMLVTLENGATVYGSVPRFLSEAQRGDEVEFKATFEVAEDDKTHAFFKRPTC
ncbi:hypothetical protein Arno162_28 [Pectobacterium phage Arno162]|uniref:Uncharacterized protein n=1 Tax=Pectobacterium phage Arno162 TaxID=2500577 RepID=A0A678ZJI6_9CAUD|nr:hypothetical protein Arno162_28 [Pectobacterium phage Arno162]